MSVRDEPQEEMHVDPQRAKVLLENISAVAKRVEQAANGRKVRLVAVSKLKPANDILALHQSSHGQIDFGENYAQELTEKAALLPRSLRWHMMGALQTNKCKPLAEQVHNLWCVSSVDSTKKADQLEKGRAALAEKVTLEHKLRVLVQVNTSGEDSKSGVDPADVVNVCKHVKAQCPHLQLAGLMTIGAIARSKESTPETENEDFTALHKARDDVANALQIRSDDLTLSMGMSSDFEAAIKQGSDEVRVGTTIFGERPAKADAKVKDETATEKT